VVQRYRVYYIQRLLDIFHMPDQEATPVTGSKIQQIKDKDYKIG